MEHKIIEREEFTVVGMPIKVSLKDPEYQKKIKELWYAFIPRAYEINFKASPLYYGLCNVKEGIEGDECSFEYVAGVEVSQKEIPEGMKFETVPKAKYFVVTHKGRVETLGNTYQAIEAKMKELNLKEDKNKIFFEQYDQRFKEDSDDSEFEIYSPINEDL